MVFGFCLCYVPQIIKLYKLKSAKDISVGQYWLSILGYVASFAYSYLTVCPLYWFLNQAIGLILCAWVIVLYYKYQ